MSNPEDINSNHHIMLTRSKRKVSSDSVISIEEPYNQKTLKKMKNSNNFFELGDDWDAIEEELYFNDLDNDNLNNKDNNLSLRISRESTPYPYEEISDIDIIDNDTDIEETYMDIEETDIDETHMEETDMDDEEELDEVAEILADFINNQRRSLKYKNDIDNIKYKKTSKLKEKIKDESLVIGKYNKETKKYYKKLVHFKLCLQVMAKKQLKKFKRLSLI